MTLSSTARAKINLTLHVGRKIADPHDPFFGYHPIDSLVAFADIGDTLKLTYAEPKHALSINGPFSQNLNNGDENLIIRALEAAEAKSSHVELIKNLPVSAGIGGGSANAAAVLRMLGVNDLHVAVGLGADVPVCLNSETAHMTGIGEDVSPWPGLGRLNAVLVNPGVSVSTAEIFENYDSGEMVRDTPRPQKHDGGLLDHALNGRNDLQSIAISKAPVIAKVIAVLENQKECQLARMSGSGATCFGIYSDDESAKQAAENIQSLQADWWVVQTVLGDA